MKLSLSAITGGAAAIMFAPTTASGASSITKNVKEVIKNLRHGSNIVHNENRDLQNLLEAGSSSSCVTVTALDESTNTVTVDVRQCLLGTSAGTGDMCAATDGEDADLFFATYKKQNGSSVCGFKKNRADACYVEAIANVPCDSKTNTATVTLYARDNTLLDASDMVENPKLGDCSVGNGKWARYTISEEVIVDCVAPPPTGVNPPGTCSDTYNNCAAGEYCNFHYERGYECKAYTPVGGTCGGLAIFGEESICDPSISFCYESDYCFTFIADSPGTCEAFASLPEETCKTNDDCDTASGEWCDVNVGKCKYGIKEGACCDVLQDNCDVGLMCAPQTAEGNDGGEFVVLGSEATVCQPEGGPVGNNPPGTCSDTYNNCVEGEYCNEHWERGYECKAYVSVGDSCGGFTMQGDDNRCDPSESFCYSPDECYSMVADEPGTCEALASLGDETCSTSADCDTASGEWCDIYLGKCKHGIAEGACCDVLQDNCDVGLLCGPRSTEGGGGDGSIVSVGSDATVCQPEGVGGPIGNNAPGTCSETHDNCAEGEYCNKHWERGYECKAYVNVNDSCGGYTRQGDDERCDPSTAFCYYPDDCMIADISGTCQAFASDETCTTNADCDTASGDWCDVPLGKCKKGLENGACCDNNLQNCDIGYTCANTSTSTKYARYMCQPVAP